MERRLFQRFFDRPALEVAEDILGKVLVRRKGETLLYGIITEVEAYDGPEDKASHAHRGRTPRNAPMFGPAGHWYIYLVYGMHWMLNIVTGPVGYPAAVLIRGISEEWAGNSLSHGERARVRGRPHLHDGPGKLTRALRIDQSFNAQRAVKETGLWVEDHSIIIPRKQIQRTPRIGVDYAGAWAKKPYRFVIPSPTGEGYYGLHVSLCFPHCSSLPDGMCRYSCSPSSDYGNLQSGIHP